MPDRPKLLPCGHVDCAGLECPKCGTSPCCWHLDGCDYYRVISPVAQDGAS